MLCLFVPCFIRQEYACCYNFQRNRPMMKNAKGKEIYSYAGFSSLDDDSKCFTVQLCHPPIQHFLSHTSLIHSPQGQFAGSLSCPWTLWHMEWEFGIVRSVIKSVCLKKALVIEFHKVLYLAQYFLLYTCFTQHYKKALRLHDIRKTCVMR